MKRNNLEMMVLTALMTGLVAVATASIVIPIPFTSGYIHPGDSMIFLAALILGWKRGAVAAGLGAAFADMFLGFVFWAPWTLFIKGCMAAIVGLVVSKCAGKRHRMLIACGATVIIWLIFNAVVHGVILYDTTSGVPAATEAVQSVDPSALGSAVRSIQSKLMATALLIPLALLATALLLRKKANIVVPPEQIIGMTSGGLFMVFGYYLAGGMIYGNFTIPALEIPSNMIQFTGGFLIAALISAALKKTVFKKYFYYSSD
ncbi:MAG: ECF transporter S component [Clostridiales Family XIII bacterium]|nr:ECF transporter S component [Clostridiales Family XIII bacterium]